MPWFLTIIVLIFTFHRFSEAKHNNKHPSAVVVGTVYSDTCFQQDFHKTSHFISGALVSVECEGTSSNPSFREEVKTNEHGEFTVHLPFSVSKHIKKINGCSVKLISSTEPYCSIASTATTSSSLHLKSRTKGTLIFSAGFFTFKPLKQPRLCNQKSSTHNTKRFNSRKFSTPIPGIPNFTAATKDPLETSEQSNRTAAQHTFFPPIPKIPQIPGFPPIPGIPPLPPFPFWPPFPFRPPPPIVPPNHFQPPPSILPPNPLQPPPSISPPNFLQPPHSLIPPNPLQPPPMLPPNPLQPPPSLVPPSTNPLQPPPSIIPPPSLIPPKS